MIFLGFDISNIIFILKIIGFILTLGFAVGLVLALLGQYNVSEREKRKREEFFDVTYDDHPQEQTRWTDIQAHFQSQNSTDWRMAIIDADSMLEDLITGMGYQGTNFGEKLKSMSHANFPSLDAAWHVHKLRNTLAHQGSSYHLTDRESYQAFKIYEQIFHDTGYIS